MSTHETIIHDNHVEPGSDRSFGLIVGGILAAIGIYQFFSGSALYLWFAGPGVALVLAGLAVPKLLHRGHVPGVCDIGCAHRAAAAAVRQRPAATQTS
jgi:hypothetical protein